MTTRTYDSRSLPPEAQEHLRQRVVDAVVQQKMSKVEAARAFGVGRTSVHLWVQAYEAGGKAALKSKPRGRPKRSRLKGHQAATIVRMVTKHTPDQLKLPFSFWTRKAVQRLIADRYDIHVSVWSVGRYLKRWGFTLQRPIRRTYERDPNAVKCWREEMAAIIVQRARKRNAYIVFVDETGFMLSPIVRRTWAPRGRTPVIKVTKPHERISVIGAVTISPKRSRFGFQFHLSEDNANFHGHSVVRFIGGLRNRLRSRFTLLWDEIPIHRTKAVNDYLAKHRSIVVEPFPHYAPELNPVDYVWSYVKYDRLANYCPSGLIELRQRIIEELSRLREMPDLLESLFKPTGFSL